MRKDKKKQLSTNHDSNDEAEEEDDGVVCGICLDGNVYDNNEILLCDKCDIPVHQTCYGILTIPKGSWYCAPCSKGLDPKVLQCELCSNKGGAYKFTVDGKWAHGLCATWIPEVYGTGDQGQILNLSLLDHKRMKLKCQICQSKNSGCSIQCSYGKCTKSAHPWCIFYQPEAGYASRIIRDDKDETVWEVFCKSHSNCVKDPFKPKAKAKSQPLFISDKHDDDNFDDLEPKNDYLKSSKSKKKETQNIKISNVDDNASIDVESDFDEVPVLAEMKKVSIEVPSKTSKIKMKNSIPIYSISEWPGQAEGEGLDLEQFWNVASMSFPEDHNTQWTEFIIAPFLNNKYSGEFTSTITTSGSSDYEKEEFASEIESKLSSYGTERDKHIFFDDDKRETFVNNTFNMINTLKPNVYQFIKPSLYEKNVSDDSFETFKSNKVFKNEDSIFLIDEVRMLDNNERDDFDKSNQLKTVFNVLQRYAARFKVELKQKDIVNCDEVNQTLINLMDLPTIEVSKVIENVIISNDLSFPIPTLSNYYARLLLDDYSKIDDNSAVQLLDKTVISKHQENEINEIIKSYEYLYQYLHLSCYQSIDDILSSNDFKESLGKFLRSKYEFKAVETLYMKQRIWSKVCAGVIRGVKDQSIDFNNHSTEAIPASWKINRNLKLLDEETDISDDAICMVCFDGLSVDSNRIIYCDGCNISVHQTCYGISEIPDGDYFCDRCEGIKEMSVDRYNFKSIDAVDAIMCCLCPNHHGGLKPTTDGRWVHLTCAIWSNDAIIHDLHDMSPIDLSNVKTSDNEKLSYCVFCKTSFGFLTSCVGTSETVCDRFFHPLCAWFEGASVESILTDPTCRGLERNGMFPSGLSFKFTCLSHSSDNDRSKQKKLRLKYQVKVEDLEGIPGQKFNKRKNKRKPTNQNARNKKTQNINTVNRDLNKDVYDSSICGICLSSTETNCMNWKSFETVIFPNLDDHGEIIDETEKLSFDDKFIRNLICKECIIINHDETIADNMLSVEESSKISMPESESNNKSSFEGEKKVLSESNNCAYENKFIDEKISNHKSISNNGIFEENLLFNHSVSSPVLNGMETISCATCKVTVHRSCLSSLGIPNMENLVNYYCDPCVLGLTDCRCVLCPRRGGFFKSTIDKKWCHVFCARHTVGNIKILFRRNVQDIQSISTNFSDNNAKISNEENISNEQTHNASLIDSISSQLPSIADVKEERYKNTNNVELVESEFPSILIDQSNQQNNSFLKYDQSKFISNLMNVSYGIIDIRGTPKENRKQKCYLCNRRQGQPNQCNFPECVNYFHSICLIRSLNGYIKVRSGNIECYCCDHKPEGVEIISFNNLIDSKNELQVSTTQYSRDDANIENQIPNLKTTKQLIPLGCWIDTYEINRFRNILDSTRTIIDSINRREKLKKLVNKADSEYFSSTVNKQLDKIKGRKNSNMFSNVDMSEIFDYSSNEDDDNTSIDNEDNISGTENGQQIIEKKKSNQLIDDNWIIGLLQDKKGKSLNMVTRAGDVSISGTFLSNNAVRLPKIFCQVAGYEFDNNQMLFHENRKSFEKALKNFIEKQKVVTREACFTFASAKEANDFYKNISNEIVKLMNLPLNEFKESIKPLTFEYPKLTLKEKVAKKKGYVVFDEEIKIGKFEFKEEIISTNRRRKTVDLVDFIEQPLKKFRKRGNEEDSDQIRDKVSESLKDSILSINESGFNESFNRRSTRSTISSEPIINLDERYLSHKKSIISNEPIVNHDARDLSNIKSTRSKTSANCDDFKMIHKSDDIVETSVDIQKSKKRKNSSLSADISNSNDNLQETTHKKSLKSRSSSHFVEEIFNHLNNTEVIETVGINRNKDNREEVTISPYVNGSVSRKSMRLQRTFSSDKNIIPVNTVITDEKTSDNIVENARYHRYKFSVDKDVYVEPKLTVDRRNNSKKVNRKTEMPNNILSTNDESIICDVNLSSSFPLKSEKRLKVSISAYKKASKVAFEIVNNLTEEDLIRNPMAYCIVNRELIDNNGFDGIVNQFNVFKTTEPVTTAQIENDNCLDNIDKILIDDSNKFQVCFENIANDYYVYTIDQLFILERRIQEILFYLENCDSLDFHLSELRNLETNKSPTKKSKKYFLCESFMTIPQANLSMYKQYVKRIITIDVLKDLLKKHCYHSFHQFSKFFFDMLNNARVVTNRDSEVWRDSEYLSFIFDKLKEESLSKSLDIPNSSKKVLSYRLSVDKTYDRDDIVMLCCNCSNEFILYNWPNKWKVTDSTYKYICPPCIQINSENVIGFQVKVWWNRDKKHYNGKINAYDKISNKHRILYEDNEWEFLRLCDEPVIFNRIENFSDFMKIDSQLIAKELLRSNEFCENLQNVKPE